MTSAHPLRITVTIGLAVALAGSALVVASRAFGWQAGPLYFLVAGTPYVGAALLGLALVAVLVRAWWIAAAAGCLAAVVAWWWVPAFVADPGVAPGGLRVMTTNLQFGRADPAAVVSAVRDFDVELLSVQELTPQAQRALRKAGLDEVLPHRFSIANAGSGAAGTGMWSRYALTDRTDTDDLIFENLAATVAAPNGPITFFALHPIPPQPLDGSRGTAVFAGVARFLAARPGPAIAAGDLNATTDNEPLRAMLAAGWIDAADSAGAGLVRTWPNDLAPLPPLVALDHVLTRDTSPAAVVQVREIPGTDHVAVVAELGTAGER